MLNGILFLILFAFVFICFFVGLLYIGIRLTTDNNTQSEYIKPIAKIEYDIEKDEDRLRCFETLHNYRKINPPYELPNNKGFVIGKFIFGFHLFNKKKIEGDKIIENEIKLNFTLQHDSELFIIKTDSEYLALIVNKDFTKWGRLNEIITI